DVTVNDTERPTVAAPPAVEAPNDPGLCSATIDPGAPHVSDNCPGATASGARSDGQALGASYPVGTTSITWTPNDAHGNASVPPATQTIEVDDLEHPSLTGLTSSPAALWPPDHTMRSETIGYTESDNCPGSSCALSVTSSEPVNGLGDGDTAP